jgi:predicted HAD superfamily hydrolase
MLECINKRKYRIFESEVRRRDIKIVSVDVFDTLLLRETKPEYLRFLDIANQQIGTLKKSGYNLNFDSKDLLLSRIMAARAAYRNTAPVDGIREATYDEILEIVTTAGSLPSSCKALLKKAELDYELGALRPNLFLVDILRHAINASKRVICLSDMYFGANDIRYLLDSLLPTLSVHKVYSSADFGYGKSSGRIYKSIAKLENVEPHHIIHCGDNFFSDFEMANRSGVVGHFVPRSLLWRLIQNLRQRHFNSKFKVE